MKFFASFAAVVLLALAVVEAAEHHKHHHAKHHVKHHHAKHHHARAGDNCEWKCVDQNNMPVTSGIATDNAWAIELQTNSNPSQNSPIIMIYNPAGVFIIYNETIEILIVFVRATKTFSICKYTTGDTLVINFTMGTAIYNNVAGVSKDMGNLAPFAAIQKLVDNIDQNLKTFYRPDASGLPNLFNMFTYIKFTIGSGTDPLTKKTTIQEPVMAAFGPYLNTMKARLSNNNNEIYNASFKVLNSLVPALGELKPIHKMYRDIIATQWMAKDINGDTTELLRRLSYGSYFVGGFINNLLTSVTVDMTNLTLEGPNYQIQVANANGAITDLKTNTAAGMIGSTDFSLVNKNMVSSFSSAK